MTGQRIRRAMLWSATLALLLAGAGHSIGQTFLIDDFDDMIFDGWSTVDLSVGQPWGPGLYDVSNRDLRMAHSGSIPVLPGTPTTEKLLIAIWDASTDPVFSNGYVHAQMRTNVANNSTSIIMRTDLSTFSSYVLFGNTTVVPPDVPGSKFAISKFVNGAEIRLWNSDIEYLPGEDWNVEFGAVGDQLSAKVWKLGEPEPLVPQFVGSDPSLVSGQIALASDVVTREEPSFADATFDDIYFTPEFDLQVPLDIKPGSYPNSVNLKSKGVLPVALVSTDEFDALTVDPDSILFGDLSQITYGGRRIGPIRYGEEDVTGDGLLDLTLKFSMPELVSNGALGARSVEAYLSATAPDGDLIGGVDAVRIVGTVAIPEPSTLVLVMLGFVGLLAATWRRR